MLSSNHFNHLYQNLAQIKEWQEKANEHVGKIQLQLEELSQSSNKLSDRVERATEHVDTGKKAFDWHNARHDYLLKFASLFKKISEVEGKLNKKDNSIALDSLAKELNEISVSAYTASDGSKITEPNKALIKSLIENIKRASDETCDRFTTSSFVNRLFPFMAKLMKQHILRSSDIEQTLGKSQQMDENLLQAISCVRAASILDSTSSSLSMVNVGAINRIQKVYLSQLSSTLSKSTDEIISFCLSTLKSNNNAETAFSAFLLKFFSLVESTWSLTFVLFGKDNINTFETTRKFLFQKFSGQGEFEGTIHSLITNVFESHFSDFLKKITKKSSNNSLKTPMDMLFALYSFYGDPTCISFYPLRILQKELSEEKRDTTAWTIKYLNQNALIEFAKYFVKTLDSSPPANVTSYLEEYLGGNDAIVILEKFQQLLRSISLLVSVSSSFTYQPAPKEVLNDFITNANSFLGELPASISKNVAKGVQKLLSNSQSLSQAKDISYLSTTTNFLDLEAIAVYKQVMPEIISSLNSSISSLSTSAGLSSSASRKKSKFQDLI